MCSEEDREAFIGEYSPTALSLVVKNIPKLLEVK